MEPREEAMGCEAPHAVSVLVLGGVFLRIGASAFGGLGAALALVERELVDKRRWLTPADLTEALTYTKLLPGSTVVQVVSYLGYRLGGWSGSAVATAAFVAPSLLSGHGIQAATATFSGVDTRNHPCTFMLAADEALPVGVCQSLVRPSKAAIL